MGNSNSLFASLIWGSVGLGFFIYGKKQKSGVPLFGGLAMIGISYFVSSALYMSLVSAAILAGMIWMIKRGG